MRIHALSGRADSTTCPSGTFFYSCVANGFRGCCSRDPCSLPDCPDTMPSSSLKDPGGTDDSGDAGRRGKNTPTATTEDSSEKPQATNSDKASKTLAKAQTTTTQKTTTRTDSGVTHTVPNDSIVTVTKHTLIITGRPTTTSTSAAAGTGTDSTSINTAAGGSEATSGPTPSQTDTASSRTSSGSALSSGAIVGLAVGGVVLVAIITVLLFAFKRHRKNNKASHRTSDSRDAGREGLVEEKKFPQSMSTHTTGTQGSGDPFAPFGGRVDQKGDPISAPSGAFEMDATSNGPVELPAGSPVSAPNKSNQTPTVSGSSSKPTRLDPVRESVSTDPRATLNALGNDSGRPAYVNHWNQYKSLDNG